MTQKQFDSEIRRLERRMRLLREANSGAVKLRRIDIKRCKVSAHMREAHTRLIAPAGWKSRASTTS